MMDIGKHDFGKTLRFCQKLYDAFLHIF